MIQYEGVAKAFDRPVLRGVDLRIEPGEIVSIVGPSGTGKSVLLKTTIGLLRPDRGRVLVDGEVVGGVGGRSRTSSPGVGYVFQHAALFDSQSVFDNVAEGIPEDELRRIPARALAARVGEALERVRLDPLEVANQLPAELSGGMRKRVGIARAVVGRPRILLYDEPVTGLDPMTATAVHDLILELARELDATSLLVTHDVGGALDISDRMALLYEGLIRFEGTPGAFRESGDAVVAGFRDTRAPAELLEVG